MIINFTKDVLNLDGYVDLWPLCSTNLKLLASPLNDIFGQILLCPLWSMSTLYSFHCKLKEKKLGRPMILFVNICKRENLSLLRLKVKMSGSDLKKYKLLVLKKYILIIPLLLTCTQIFDTAASSERANDILRKNIITLGQDHAWWLRILSTFSALRDRINIEILNRKICIRYI